MTPRSRIPALVAALLIATLLASAPPLRAEGHLGIYGLRMTPSNQDAEQYSRAGYGGGLQVIAPLPGAANLLAGVLGFEYVNLLNRTHTFRDAVTQLRVEQQTEQHFLRLYVGPRFGLHGTEFFRPYLGASLALHEYGISTDVVIPNDADHTLDVRQDLGSEERVAFGYDLTAGVDFDILTRFSIDVGGRFVRSFNVPQQLGEGSVPVSPAYAQVFVGFGVSFGAMGERR